MGLDKIVGDDISILNTPVACIHHVNAMLRLLEETHITDAEVLRAYYDTLQIAIVHRDQARMRVFAQHAYNWRVALEEEDSLEPGRLKGFVERPSPHRIRGTTNK